MYCPNHTDEEIELVETEQCLGYGAATAYFETAWQCPRCGEVFTDAELWEAFAPDHEEEPWR